MKRAKITARQGVGDRARFQIACPTCSRSHWITDTAITRCPRRPTGPKFVITDPKENTA
jgi:hypothetical protein